jgi:hypothetical protein
MAQVVIDNAQIVPIKRRARRDHVLLDSAFVAARVIQDSTDVGSAIAELACMESKG